MTPCIYNGSFLKQNYNLLELAEKAHVLQLSRMFSAVDKILSTFNIVGKGRGERRDKARAKNGALRLVPELKVKNEWCEVSKGR